MRPCVVYKSSRLMGGILVTGRLSEERDEVTKVVRGLEGLLPRRPHQPPEVVGSVDNSSGRASWRCSSWNWANAVKPLPRHDHFAKWKIIFQLSNFLQKTSLKKNHQKMIKKRPKNDPQKTEKRPPPILHTSAIPPRLTYRKRGGV